MTSVIAILITAFNARQYILDTLKSLKDQSLPNGWQIKFYIGVDACTDTADILDKNKISYYYTEENVGTYVLTNSLLEKAKDDNCNIFVRFDSDDIACENFLLYGIEHVLKFNFINPYQILVDKDLTPISNELKIAHGSMFATRTAIESLGGYYHYRVGCDTNFLKRAKRLGYNGKILKNTPVYLYRQHSDSLMKNKDLGKGSVIRKQSWSEIKEKFAAGENKIKNPVTIDLKFRENKNDS